jgi:hypothetical protein
MMHNFGQFSLGHPHFCADEAQLRTSHASLSANYRFRDYLMQAQHVRNGEHIVALIILARWRSEEGQDGHSLPSQLSLLLNLSQALLQALKLRTDLLFHGVL